MTTTVEAVYQKHIEALSVQEKLQLVALITEQLASISEKQNNGEPTVKNSGFRTKEFRTGSPQVVLQFAGTLSTKEAQSLLLATNEARSIDWEMWE